MIAETRSKETGFHVKRVTEYSYIIAKTLGLSEEKSNILRLTSPMHDIGKVGIPDKILKKPGKLDENEFEIINTHVKLGYEMLKHSKKEILRAAATIAHEHHEMHNGQGYPRGLKENEIHIYAKITAATGVLML